MQIKKLLLISAVCATSFSTHAQVLITKDGTPILPEKGDWSIGFDATRLIKMADLGFFTGSQMITGKYMVDSVTAWRAGFRIGVNSWSHRQRAVDRGHSNANTSHPASFMLRDNVWTRNSFTAGFSFGIEKRRGKTRLQGIYGVEGLLFVSMSVDKFNYATRLDASPSNQIGVDTLDIMRSSTHGAANNVVFNAPIVNIDGPARIVERNNGLAFTLGARAFIGAEYFVLPKLSIGGEFGWGMGFTTTGRSEIIYESIGSGSDGPGVRRTTVDGNVTTGFSLDTDTGAGIGGPSASLRVNLYF